MRSMKTQVSSCLVGTFVALGLCAFGPAQEAVADETVLVAITHYEQQQSWWCWATAAQIVIRFHGGGTRTQCTYVSYGLGQSICANKGGTYTQIEKLVDAYLGHGGDWTAGALSWGALYGAIYLNRPIISWLVWGSDPHAGKSSGGMHVVTVYGYSTVGSTHYVYYSNADANVGTGTSATKKHKKLSNFQSSAKFSNTDNMTNVYN